VSGTCIKNGGLQNTSLGYTAGTEGIQEEAGTAKKKLDGQLYIVRWDMKDMGTTWDEAEELATNRAEWHQRVAQYIHLDAGWTKVQNTGLPINFSLVANSYVEGGTP